MLQRNIRIYYSVSAPLSILLMAFILEKWSFRRASDQRKYINEYIKQKNKIPRVVEMQNPYHVTRARQD